MSQTEQLDEETCQERIDTIKELIREGNLDTAIPRFEVEQVQKADEALRTYGATAEVGNLDMPDRMIGWLRVLFEMEAE